MFKILHDLLEFLKGLPDVLRGVLGLLNEAPDPYREPLIHAFWIVVILLPMLLLGFKLLSSRPYRNVYSMVGRVVMFLVKEVKDDWAAQPATPLGRKVSAWLRVVAGYAAVILCSLFFLAIALLMVLSDRADGIAMLGGAVMLAVSGYFVHLGYTLGRRERCALLGRDYQ